MWTYSSISGRRVSAVVAIEGQQRRRARRSDIFSLNTRTPLTVLKPGRVTSGMDEGSLRASNIGRLTSSVLNKLAKLSVRGQGRSHPKSGSRGWPYYGAYQNDLCVAAFIYESSLSSAARYNAIVVLPICAATQSHTPSPGDFATGVLTS